MGKEPQEASERFAITASNFRWVWGHKWDSHRGDVIRALESILDLSGERLLRRARSVDEMTGDCRAEMVLEVGSMSNGFRLDPHGLIRQECDFRGGSSRSGRPRRLD